LIQGSKLKEDTFPKNSSFEIQDNIIFEMFRQRALMAGHVKGKHKSKTHTDKCSKTRMPL
jgi:hypothetical protein